MFPPRQSISRNWISARAKVVTLVITSLVVLSLSTCTDVPGPTPPDEPPVSRVAPTTDAPNTSLIGTVQGTIPLPIFQGITSSGTAFGIVQNGSGGDGYFLINNLANSKPALRAATTGTGSAGEFATIGGQSGSPAIRATSSGLGPAGFFQINSSVNSNPALQATTTGRGEAAIFSLSNPSNSSAVLVAVTGGTGSAANFIVSNSANSRPVLRVQTEGTGSALSVSLTNTCMSSPTACNLAVFGSNGANQIRFGRLGRGYFNGGTQTGGADVAEAFEVEGQPSEYEPGDVLVISTTTDRRVERSRTPYSTLVAGVYATRPGVLLTERHIDANLDDTVPLGVVGVIPTKVSAENGPIHRGDLLVTARTPGHAMWANPARVRVGATLGKALETFTGPGTGLIRVLVNAK